MPNADVVIVGGGLAGLVAANRARELGLSAIVLEASPYPFYVGDTRLSAGNIHLMGLSPKAEPDAIVHRVMQRTGGAANEPVVRAFANKASRAIDWLAAHGAEFKAGHWLAPSRGRQLGAPWEDWGPDRLVQSLTESLLRGGGHLVLGAHCDRLISNSGRVVGVSATWDEEPVAYYGRVLLADGGFQASPSLMERFISPQPQSLLMANAGSAEGTGVMMARAAGAKCSDMRSFQGHLFSRDAIEVPELWPHPTLDALAAAGIVVNGRGERVADEGRPGAYLANQLAWSEEPLDYWLICDSLAWESVGRGVDNPGGDPDAANPDIEDRGGRVLRAETIVELAALAKLPADALDETVESYNTHLADGHAMSLEPPRTESKPLIPIGKAPFFAIPIVVGVVKTMGGPLTDASCRVIRDDGSLIEGLYAIGGCMGGLDGGENAANFGGLAAALIGGLIAAEHAASTKASTAGGG